MYTKIMNNKKLRIFSYLVINFISNLFFLIIWFLFVSIAAFGVNTDYDYSGWDFGFFFFLLVKMLLFYFIANKMRIIDDFKNKDKTVILSCLIFDVLLFIPINMIVILWVFVITIPMLVILLFEVIFRKIKTDKIKTSLFDLIYMMINILFIFAFPFFVGIYGRLDSPYYLISLLIACIGIDIFKNLFILGGLYLFKYFPFKNEYYKKIYINHQIFSFFIEYFSVIFIIMKVKSSVLYAESGNALIVAEKGNIISISIIILSYICFSIVKNYMGKKFLKAENHE